MSDRIVINNDSFAHRVTDFEMSIRRVGPYASAQSIENQVVDIKNEGCLLTFPSSTNSLDGDWGMAYYKIFGGVALLTRKWTTEKGEVYVTCEKLSHFDYPWYNLSELTAAQEKLREIHGSRSIEVWGNGPSAVNSWSKCKQRDRSGFREISSNGSHNIYCGPLFFII